eukprot:3580187-Amphidinium_carterae.1
MWPVTVRASVTASAEASAAHASSSTEACQEAGTLGLLPAVPLLPLFPPGEPGWGRFIPNQRECSLCAFISVLARRSQRRGTAICGLGCGSLTASLPAPNKSRGKFPSRDNVKRSLHPKLSGEGKRIRTCFIGFALLFYAFPVAFKNHGVAEDHDSFAQLEPGEVLQWVHEVSKNSTYQWSSLRIDTKYFYAALCPSPVDSQSKLAASQQKVGSRVSWQASASQILAELCETWIANVLPPPTVVKGNFKQEPRHPQFVPKIVRVTVQSALSKDGATRAR